MPSNVVAPGILTPAQMMFLLREVGFPEDKIPTMVAVGIAESLKDAKIDTVKSGTDVGKKREYSIGLWQINWKAHKDGVLKDLGITNPEQLRDPLTNAQAAVAVYNERSQWEDGFRAWSKYKNKEYKQYLPDMEVLAIRTKPTMVPARSGLREEMRNNINIAGGRGMSKPIGTELNLDNAPKIPVGGKEYKLGEARDLFIKGDEKTKNEILTILQQYEPNVKYTRKDSANTAWNKLVENYSVSNSVAPKPFTTWLTAEAEYKIDAAGMGDGTSTLLQPSITSKQEAYDDFNTFIFESTGLKANPKDAQEYYNKLRQLEKTKVAKQVTTKTGTTTTQVVTGGITKEDREALAASFVNRYIDVKGIQNVGGIVGTNLATLRKLASDYNVVLSDADIRKYAVDSLTNKTVLNNAELKIKNTAKVRYQNLGNFIDQGLTVKDIASQYINTMARVLEVNPDTISLDNKYIDKALSTLSNFTDFNQALRSGSEWQYTNNAREEAASYINRIKQDFGLA